MRNLKYSVGLNRFDKRWQNKEISWEELKEKLASPHRTVETVAQYQKFSKVEKDKAKDIGGFVGGHLQEGRRKADTVLNRSMVTLDADFAKDSFWDDLVELYDFTCLIYSTHSSTNAKPRLRLVVPLSRDVSPEEYEAIARHVADMLGIEQFDDTSYQASRLMYWPSCPTDGIYIFKSQDDGDLLDVEKILSTYDDWKDVSFWPVSSRQSAVIQRKINKLGDPTEKLGALGAFCRAYTISSAIDTFLPEVYDSTSKSDRYTYINGSTAAGLVVYDDKLAYSNHSTDPANDGGCHNAFDLVRIHKFIDLDVDCKKDTPVNKLPSYTAMMDLVLHDENTSKIIGSEKFEQAKEDFKDADIKSTDEVFALLERDKGGVVSSIANVVTILEHDPNLQGIFAYNEFDYRDVALRNLPWRKIGKTRSDNALRDRDDANLRLYIEKMYGLTGREKIKDGLATVIEKNRIHPVRDYLDACVWDGTPRVDTLLVDYLGAEDNEYVRAVTRKTLIGAVARIYSPGIKFDTMLTLVGPQGIGKSTIFNRLGGIWYSDSLVSVTGKESYEQLQGCWIMEVGELSAMKKAETEAIKNYLSKCEDRYRQAYASRAEAFPRQTIFIGTTNQAQFLKDETGNRRFWIVDVKGSEERNLFTELDKKTVQLIWAEAKLLFEQGEELYLSKEIETLAKEAQSDHSEEDIRLGLIKQYLDMKIPVHWEKLDMWARQEYVRNYDEDDDHCGCKMKTRVCAAEIWCEVFGKNQADIDRYKAKEINAMLSQVVGWERWGTIRFSKPYGHQKGFRRQEIDEIELPF